VKDRIQDMLDQQRLSPAVSLTNNPPL